MGAFQPFGFDEHSAITWEDFAKFAHRVYEGEGPSRQHSRHASPVKSKRNSRPGSMHRKLRDRPEDGNSGQPSGPGSGEGSDAGGGGGRNGRRTRGSRSPGSVKGKRKTKSARDDLRSDDEDEEDDDDARRRRSRKASSPRGSRASSRRRALRHEDDSDGSDEERYTVSSRGPRRRSPSRGRLRPRTTATRRRKRIRKRKGRGARAGGYHTESAMTDASVGRVESGYNSTGGRRRNIAPDSDSDETPARSKGKRRGRRKGKGSVKKPPKNLPPGWSAAWDGQYNRYYYYNSKGVVTWDRPAE